MMHIELLGNRGEQQDAAAWHEGMHGLVAVVCDGHGTLGAIASATAVRMIIDALKHQGEIDPSILREVFREVHDNLATRTPHSGTTATVVFRSGKQLLVAYVGDSEARVARADGSLHTLTIPHRLKMHREERLRLERAGTSFSDEYVFNDANEGLQVTRALGDPEFDPYVLHEPEIIAYTLTDERFLVMGSDGFWEPIARRSSRRKKIENILRTAETEEEVSKNILALLEPLTLFDNVTVLFGRFV